MNVAATQSSSETFPFIPPSSTTYSSKPNNTKGWNWAAALMGVEGLWGFVKEAMLVLMLCYHINLVWYHVSLRHPHWQESAILWELSVECCELFSETSCKWRKHLKLYSKDLDSFQRWTPIFRFPLSSPPFSASCSTKMTKKVEKSGFRIIIPWLLWLCRNELRFELVKKKYPSFPLQMFYLLLLDCDFLALGFVVKQVLFMIDLSKWHLPINPPRSRCSSHGGEPALALSCLVTSDRCEAASMGADSRPAFSLRSSAGPADCPPSGWRDKMAGELMRDAGRELCTLKCFCALHSNCELQFWVTSWKRVEE